VYVKIIASQMWDVFETQCRQALTDRTALCRDEVLEVIMDDGYDTISPVIDAVRELGPKVCGRISVYKQTLVFYRPLCG